MRKKTTAVIALLLVLCTLFGCKFAPNNETTTTSVISTVTGNISAEKETTTAKATTTTTTTATAATTAKTTEAKTTKKAAASTAKNNTTKALPCCYITIECKSILDNTDKLKEGHEDYVPSNGIVLKKTKCTFDKGASVWDILQEVCGNNSVKLTTKNTTFGVYVSGINNLDEFDCGKQSGWVYTVNGKSPPVSCSKYTVSDGDTIVFKYICEYQN